MSATIDTSQVQVGNGGGASGTAMIQEEELRGLPRDVVPEHGTGTKGRLPVAFTLNPEVTNYTVFDVSARLPELAGAGVRLPRGANPDRVTP